MAATLCLTLAGCRSCNSENEVVRWIPPARDTIPEMTDGDSLMISPDTIARTQNPSGNNARSKRKKVLEQGCNNSNSSWPEDIDLDSITLTIVMADVEMQITQRKDSI